MTASLDYLRVWGRRKRRFYSFSALFLIIVGLILLAGGVAYYLYSWQAHSKLHALNVAAPATRTLQVPQELIDQRQPLDLDPTVDLASLSQGESLRMSPSAIAAQTLYPGEVINPVFWSNPLASEPLVLPPLIEGFEPIDPASVPPKGTLASPTRLSIPAMGIDSTTSGLGILDLGDSRAYQTPKNVVGHIPETANAGEAGTSWFFGHLESPIRGEGSVFSDLPGIPKLLRQGVDVYTIVESSESTFLYKLTSSEVVHQDDLKLHDTGEPSIALVTCVPRWVYDYRLVIIGELVGIKAAITG